MAAFCWMLIEGVYLYLFVVKVYNINDKMKVSHGFSWGNYELKTHSLFDNLLKSKTLITMNITIAIIILDIIIWLCCHFEFRIHRSTRRRCFHIAGHCSRNRARDWKLYQWKFVRSEWFFPRVISLSRILVLCCTLFVCLFVCFFGLIDWFVAAVVVVLLFLCCLLLLVIKPDMEGTAYMHAQKNY